MPLDRFFLGLLLGSLLTSCVFGGQVFSSCICFVLLLVPLSLFDICSQYVTRKFVFLREVFELVDTSSPVGVSGSLRCLSGSHPLTWMWCALCCSRGDETIIES